MKRIAHAKKRDSNEKEIVNALKKVGTSVYRLDIIDLLVGYKRETFLIEVKTEKGELTESQLDFIKDWRGHELIIVKSINEALKAIGAIK